MRHVLIALFIALLPLRAWVGDAMAITMQSTAPGHEVVSRAPVDATPCPDHAMASTDAGGDHVHSSCDVCNGPAMSLSIPVEPLLTNAHGVIARPAERFASLALHPVTKPPIS